MNLDKAPVDFPLLVSRGDIDVATTADSSSLGASPTHSVATNNPKSPTTARPDNLPIATSAADTAPLVPSPLSQSATHRQQVYTDAIGKTHVSNEVVEEEWVTEVSRYGLSPANTTQQRTAPLGDQATRPSIVTTTEIDTATTVGSSPTTVVHSSANTLLSVPGKRSPDEEGSDLSDPNNYTSQQPPTKRSRTRAAPPRRIDLGEFAKPAIPPKLESVTSPLFFSHKQKPLMIRPPSFSGSEAVGTMLRSVRDSAEVTTLKLARGTVSSASPARSSSTPGSWSSIDAATLARSPDAQASSPAQQLLQGIGIVELLERDDRPTFIVDSANAFSASSPAFTVLYANPALQVSDGIRYLISGEFQDGSDARAEFEGFKTWVKNGGTNAEGLDCFMPSFHYGGIEWTCSVIRNRFRFVSANRSAASIARTSPEPQLERETSIDSRTQGATPNAQPKTPSDIVVPDAPDYFGTLASLDEDERTRSVVGSDSGEPYLMRRNSDYASDIVSIRTEQPSFDWTRIPLTEDLPQHIIFARTRDWASTPLGPTETWSADLRAMANMVMGSPHPAAMYWGPEFIAIYNEAYVPLAGKKHPALMGQSYKEAWHEIWDEVAHVFEGAWKSGQATMKNDDHLLINRYGFEEEAFFSWSIVPLVGDEGSVVGLYNPAFENTRRKVAERRMLTLREVGEKTSLARDVKSFWSQVQQGLEFNKEDIPFVMVYSVSDDSESDMSSMHSGSLSHPPQLVLEASLGIPSGHSCLISPLDLKTSVEGFAPYMRDSMAQAGVPILLSKDDGTLAEDLMIGFDFRGDSGDCQAIVIFPIHPTTGGDSVVGFIVIGVNPRRPYDDDYKLFIHLLSRQLATSMASVVLFEEEIKRGQRAARLAALDRQELTQQLHLRTQEVEESELRFTRMAEFAPVGMFIADHEGLINYCNEMWWEVSQHQPRSEYNVNTWMDSVSDEDRPALEQIWKRMLDDKMAITHEFRFKRLRDHSSGAINNWVLMSAYPERHRDGSIKGIFGCITDISQQKLAEQIQYQRREEAVELKRQQENFIDITSHEMRNPLSAILQCADEISGTLAKYRSLEEYNSEVARLKVALEGCLEAANTITLCASHQKRIVDDILTLSKLDSQLLLVTPVDVQPVAVVQRVLKMFEGELNTNSIQMKFQVKNRYLDLGVDWVRLDPSRLLQVLINLMTNAIKFTNARPERSIVVTLDASIDISERTDTDISFFPSDRPGTSELTEGADWGKGDRINLHFSVQDTGRGLDEHEKKLLFQRFSQASPRTHVQYGGSGLGLFISRILTELQGGQIGVDSVKGVGSTFSFYVRSRKSGGPGDKQAVATAPPLQRAPGSSTTIENRQPKLIAKAPIIQPMSQAGASSPSTPARPATSTPSGGQRVFDVLIVEDNLVNQKVLQRQLRNSGNNTQVANHGGEALEVLKRSRYWTGMERTGNEISVILMDLEMPVMDGMTCARKIRELEREGTIVSHIPIIAVTAYARPEQIEDAKAAGVDDVISKPFRMPELIPRIEELVNKFPSTK
ncbi:hybrid signal transduction histidine kinase K [Apiospora marii]|uniref:hybrid signal transduction histidine kinase K n=1 Tax=Apiospora marii TaxID=335849 RepID=UPI00312F5865